MSRVLLTLGIILIALAAVPIVRADSIYGECRFKDGSKAGGSVGINTSWNSKRTSPAGGRYVLDFGQKLNTTITVYCNGKTVGRVYVSGQTRLDITVP